MSLRKAMQTIKNNIPDELLPSLISWCDDNGKGWTNAEKDFFFNFNQAIAMGDFGRAEKLCEEWSILCVSMIKEFFPACSEKMKIFWLNKKLERKNVRRTQAKN